MSSEKQCTGCGATVTVGRDLNLRDVSGSKYCPKSSLGHMLSAVALPPVAIKTSPRCPTCDSPSPNLHPAVQSEGEVYLCHDDFHAPVAIKPEAALTPLEKEMLAALKELITASDFNPHRPMNPKQISLLANAQGKAQDAIAKATAAQSQAKPEVAPQVWFRETKTLNFLYIARPDGRFWVVAMETERGDIYAIENSPARNPSANPMAVQA